MYYPYVNSAHYSGVEEILSFKFTILMFPKGITKLREAATGEYRNEFLEMNEAQNIINRDSCVKQALRFMASFKCNSIIEPSDEYRLVSYLLFMYNIIIQLCATDDAVESSINNAVIDD